MECFFDFSGNQIIQMMEKSHNMKNLKRLLNLLILLATTSVCSQERTFFESNNKSYIVLNENDTFEYVNYDYFSNRDGGTNFFEINFFSKGKYHKEGSFLIFNSINPKIEDFEKSSLKIVEKTSETNNDSIQFGVSYDKRSYKIFLCGTGIELGYDVVDASGCYELYDKNIIPHLGSDDFYLRIYPNISNHFIRSIDFNQNFFDSKYYKKDSFSNVEITLDFNLNNFKFKALEDEMLFMEGDKIIHNKMIFYKVDTVSPITIPLR